MNDALRREPARVDAAAVHHLRAERLPGDRVRGGIGVAPFDGRAGLRAQDRRLIGEVADRDAVRARRRRRKQRGVRPDGQRSDHPAIVVIADRALDLVDAGREPHRHPLALAGAEIVRLELVLVFVIVATAALDLEAVHELAAVRDHERHDTGSYRLGLDPERPLAERHLEPTSAGIDSRCGRDRRGRRGGGRARPRRYKCRKRRDRGDAGDGEHRPPGVPSCSDPVHRLLLDRLLIVVAARWLRAAQATVRSRKRGRARRRARTRAARRSGSASRRATPGASR